jgi:hypothetical protein
MASWLPSNLSQAGVADVPRSQTAAASSEEDAALSTRLGVLVAVALAIGLVLGILAGTSIGASVTASMLWPTVVFIIVWALLTFAFIYGAQFLLVRREQPWRYTAGAGALLGAVSGGASGLPAVAAQTAIYVQFWIAMFTRSSALSSFHASAMVSDMQTAMNHLFALVALGGLGGALIALVLHPIAGRRSTHRLANRAFKD